MEEFKIHPKYENYEISKCGKVRNKKTNRILKTRYTKPGYERVNLYPIKGNRPVTFLIHRLVVETWIGDIPPRMIIDHIDRNPQNNHYKNLRITTQAENNRNRVMIPDSNYIIHNKFTNTFEVNGTSFDTLERAITHFKNSLN